MEGGQQGVPVAVVGAGNMGRHHVRNYAALPRADLRAVVDPDPARARELAVRHGVRAYADVEELLAAEPDLAAASVAAPTHLHAALAGRLVAAGVHVLVEKPLAATAEEAEGLIEAAARAGVVLAVGHVERFNPAVRELKRRMEAGALGTPLSAIARRVGVLPPQVKDANVILDLAVHDIDVLRYLLGAGDPDELYCNAGKAIAPDRFDFADIFLRFDGVACLLQVNWVTPVKIRSLSVTGTEGYAEVAYVTQELDFYPAHRPPRIETFAELAHLSERPPQRLDVRREEPLAVELDEFLRAVAGEPAEIVSGEEALRSLVVVERLVALADRGGRAAALGHAG